MDNIIETVTTGSIGELASLCAEMACVSGFWDDAPRLTGDDFEAKRNYVALKLGLMVSEVSEALEELRKFPAGDSRVTFGLTYYPTYGDGSPALGQVPIGDAGFGEYKPEGVAVEIADAIIRGLDLLGYLGWTPDAVEALFAEKLTYNQSRGYKHGKQC